MAEPTTLLEQIDADLKQAMRDRNDVAKLTLRAVKTAITEANASGEGLVTSDEQVQEIVQREAKRRRDAAAEYEKYGDAARSAQEMAELAVLEGYLPRQLTAEEVDLIAVGVIEETGATSMRDMGKVMPLMMQRVGSQADGRLVNQVIRARLG